MPKNKSAKSTPLQNLSSLCTQNGSPLSMDWAVCWPKQSKILHSLPILHSSDFNILHCALPIWHCSLWRRLW